MHLCRLIYSSKARPDLGFTDLRNIMEKSEKNNPGDGLTGMLCFGNSMFLQVLEGDRGAVSRAYNRILTDPRHSDAEIIECSEVSERLFSDWSMKAVQLSGTQLTDKVKLTTQRYSSAPQFSPTAMTAKQCLLLMCELNALFASSL